jgi:hypothetical protein
MKKEKIDVTKGASNTNGCDCGCETPQQSAFQQALQQLGIGPDASYNSVFEKFGFNDKSSKKMPPRDPYTGQFMKQNAQQPAQGYAGTATEIPPETIGLNYGYSPYGYTSLMNNQSLTRDGANTTIANEVYAFIKKYEKNYNLRKSGDADKELYEAYTEILTLLVREFALSIANKIPNRWAINDAATRDADFASILDLTNKFIDDLMDIGKTMDLVKDGAYEDEEDKKFLTESVKKHEQAVIDLFIYKMSGLTR